VVLLKCPREGDVTAKEKPMLTATVLALILSLAQLVHYVRVDLGLLK
jgi:hypothetical protein